MTKTQISRFYLLGFKEKQCHREWLHLWKKHFRIRTLDGEFIKLNRFRPRFSFKALRRYCIQFAPSNLYMSVTNWLFPDRVEEKEQSARAYPLGGEFIIDVDTQRFWKPNYHYRGLEYARDISLSYLDKIQENYKDIRIIFSGEKGFHIHILDFDFKDWANRDSKNVIKSHEVARFRYTKYLQQTVGGFDKYHFVVSSDTMRVITFPESLNAKTGLICKNIDPKEFESLDLHSLVMDSSAERFLYPSFSSHRELVDSSDDFVRILAQGRGSVSQ